MEAGKIDKWHERQVKFHWLETLAALFLLAA